MPHRVEVSPSGQSFAAEPDVAILDAALAAGLALPYGCQSGACRSCRAKLIGGEIHYPDGSPKALNEIDEKEGFILLCQAKALGDIQIEIEEIDPSAAISVTTLLTRVQTKRELGHDVVGLELALRANDHLNYLAGQYIDVLLRDGRRRAFSLANRPGEKSLLELHIRRVPDGEFSSYVQEHLNARAILRIRGPFGSFYLRKQDPRPIILMAGGTGFAPIKAMLEDAFESGFSAPLHLYWGVRAARDLYLDALAQAWSESYKNFSYTPVLSDPDASSTWSGRTGFVHEAVAADHPDLHNHVVYMSGPPPMVAAGRSSFVAHGVDPADIHSDSFDYAFETGHDQI